MADARSPAQREHELAADGDEVPLYGQQVSATRLYQSSTIPVTYAVPLQPAPASPTRVTYSGGGGSGGFTADQLKAIFPMGAPESFTSQMSTPPASIVAPAAAAMGAPESFTSQMSTPPASIVAPAAAAITSVGSAVQTMATPVVSATEAAVPSAASMVAAPVTSAAGAVTSATAATVDRDAQDNPKDSASEDGDENTRALQRSGSDSDDSTPVGCLGGTPKKKKKKPVLVPKNTPFCHQGCCVRGSALVLSMVLLAFAGSWLGSLSPLLGDAALTLGPTAIILTYFYLRYRFSTTRRQLLITFAETVFCMVPLFLFVIGPIDLLSSWLTNKNVSVSCVWEGFGVGGRLVGVLSWGAQCALEAENGTASPLVSWSGAPCPEDRAADIQLVSPDGFIPAAVLREFFNTSTHSEAPASCDPLDLVMDDAVNGIRVTSIARGNQVVPVDSRLSLAQAHDAAYILTSPRLRLDGDEEVEINFWLRKNTILHAFVQAYFRAGFLEELLKYIAVRRVLFKDRVVDCGGLVAYSLAVGAGFAAAENVQYMLIYGASVTYVRMLFSVPLHCCTGLIIGVHLGYRKFLGQKCFCLVALIVPVFVHGTFDFLLMLPETVGGSDWRVLLALVVLIFSFLYCRCAWLRLDSVCVVDGRSMMRAGKVSQPRVCCLEREPAAGRTQSSSSISRLARTVTKEVLPSEPPCQTKPTRCPNCESGVRMHILYESFCPHCGARMPDPAPPPGTPRDLEEAVRP